MDVTRAEMLFARGVILVEGDAERFLIPVFARNLRISLDHLGISVCSVASTNFEPYAKFLVGLKIPFAVVTDWDPVEDDEGKTPLGYNRAMKLVKTIHGIQRGNKCAENLVKEIKALGEDYDAMSDEWDKLGIFTGGNTLEVDLFRVTSIKPSIIETLGEGPFGAKRRALIAEWERDSNKLDVGKYLAMVERIGKGRFAQRLASKIGKADAPGYIARAIRYVADRV